MSDEAKAAGEHTDATLVYAIANGDRPALAELYDRYASRMLALAVRIINDHRESEDVLHDVFLEIWRRAGDFDPSRGSVRAWLFVRMRSRALDRRRSPRVARRANLEAAEPSTRDASAYSGTADVDPARATDQRRVCEALQALPPPQRQVIELGYFAGLSSSAIAAQLELPIGTVKSRVAAAMSKLRASFEPVGDS